MGTATPTLLPGNLADLRARFWRGSKHLTTTDLAARLGTSPEAITLRIRRKALGIPAYRDGGTYWFLEREVDAYLADHEGQVAA